MLDRKRAPSLLVNAIENSLKRRYELFLNSKISKPPQGSFLGLERGPSRFIRGRAEYPTKYRIIQRFLLSSVVRPRDADR